MSTLETTADEVLTLFNVTPGAQTRYDNWRNGHRRDTVVPHVLAHRTRALYTVTAEDIGRLRHLKDPQEHALGEIRRREGERVRPIVNWEPDYAFTHVLHYTLESLGRVYTWQEFRRFCEHDEKANTMLWSPAEQKIKDVVESAAGCSRDDTHKAMRWRVGNAYYSFIREVHVITGLRSLGVDARFHPLADALFRADAWWDRIVLSLYIGNDEYKSGDSEGRKWRPDEILRGARPEFMYETLQLPPADKFGKVFLASPVEIKKAAAHLKALAAVSRHR